MGPRLSPQAPRPSGATLNYNGESNAEDAGDAGGGERCRGQFWRTAS